MALNLLQSEKCEDRLSDKKEIFWDIIFLAVC